MNNLFKVSLIFIKKNLKKSTSIILTMVTFMLIFNLIVGVVLSVTNNLETSIVNNKTMNLVEILYKMDSINSRKIFISDKKNNIMNNKYVATAFLDLSHPVGLDTQDRESILTNILGVPCEALAFLGVDDKIVNDTFLFVPDSFGEKYGKGTKIEFEESEFVKNGELYEGKIKKYEREITGQYVDLNINSLPPNESLIDENSAIQIAKGMTKDGIIIAYKIFVVVPNVENLKAFENSLSSDEDIESINYTLKTAKNLPQFSVILIAVSSILIALLLIISIVNIYGNIKNILNSRSRDLALYHVLGAKKIIIQKLFLLEFSFYGILAFFVSIVFTSVVFLFLKVLFSFDILTPYITYYLISNFVISIFIFVITSYFQIKRRIKNSSHSSVYKEMLR